MGVPAFYRWLLEKYPKSVEDVLEERVHLDDFGNRRPFDWSLPNPSKLECDNLYIDMNGIIHPCSHPENGPQPSTEEEMYENVCRYVDRLVRAIRPRQTLFLAIDGVAPRAKMNQQRSRRFRSAEEAREQEELEIQVRKELQQQGQALPPQNTHKPWDSNVITPGTPFMLRLSEFLRFYIRKRLTHDPGWQKLRIIFSDASIPGEGEHKIMSHVRRQRSQPGYDPNLVHVLHGLDADLIMLALATHESQFYISRELVTFGRRSQEQLEQRQLETGFKDDQQLLDDAAGPRAMETLEENRGKPLQRVSIPVLREYLAFEFQSCLTPGVLPFAPSLERLIDDIVFLCFFVGNDFLPHLPSLDIRDGALDFLFNVYKRLLPTMGDYITHHGGHVQLRHVDKILQEVGAIEDYVFQMKHENEQRQQERRQQMQQVKKLGEGQILKQAAEAAAAAAAAVSSNPKPKAMGRSARILEKKSTTAALQQQQQQQQRDGGMRALQRGHTAKLERLKRLNDQANAKAAAELKQTLFGGGTATTVAVKEEPVTEEEQTAAKKRDEMSGTKRKLEAENGDNKAVVGDEPIQGEEPEAQPSDDGHDEDNEDNDNDDDNNNNNNNNGGGGDLVVSVSPEADDAAAKAFKAKVKAEQQKKLDQHANNVEDKVRLHEFGWKDRYYSDKCKADNVAGGGGREHLFRSYVVGLCWVMKYYYSGCPSWKWYYPFHYAPFASDLRNIERFHNDVERLELAEPFRPIEQLMAVLPEDSAHAIPKESRWLMSDPESPIIDFYPKQVQVDPNGKAMPWLWVVLLPFIDERRLLDAFHPTQEKWDAKDHLCNAVGLDDGYIFVHENHGLKDSLLQIFDNMDHSKTHKTRIRCGAAKDVKGFSGSVRLPLSNEALKLDESIKVDLPSTANRVLHPSFDNLFDEAIEGNSVVCVAFTEPPKLTHKSVMLPGARPPPPSLKPEDKIIRRPKLNRGRGTIANMGGAANGKSYQAGYGSMNIGNFERDLANRTGRGHQMYQPGTRAWGAAEPTPKRPRQFYAQQPNAPPARQPPYQPNPFGNRVPPPSSSQQAQNYSNRQPWLQQQQVNYGGYHQQGYQQNLGYQQSYQRDYQQNGYNHGRTSNNNNNNNNVQQGYNRGYQGNNHGGYPQQLQQRQNYQHQGQSHTLSRQGSQRSSGYRPFTGPAGRQQQQQQSQQQQQQQQGYSFQSHNRSVQPQNRYQQPQPSRANPTVMSNLRSQLADTLRQHRNSNRR